MPDIFISYRRGDSAGHAGRLYDGLLSRFGDGKVFIDVDAIAPGVDFVERIRDAVASCDVILVLIGEDWISMTAPDGSRRIDDPEDFVRLEINAALERGIPIVPVLVEGARMPAPTDLPEDIRGLARQNAIELSDARWHYDVSRLIEAVSRLAPSDGGAATAAGDATARGPRRGLLTAAGAGVVALAVVLVVALGGGGESKKEPQGSGIATRTKAATVATGHRIHGLAGGLDALWSYEVPSGTVGRYDPETGKPLGDPARVASSVNALTVGQNAVWALSDDDRAVIKLDPQTGRPTSASLSIPEYGDYVAAGAGGVWLSVQQTPGLLRYDPATGERVKAFDVPAGAGVAAGAGTVAALNQGKLLFIDADTNEITARVPVGDHCMTAVTWGPDDYAWVACGEEHAVARVSEEGEIERVSLGHSPNDIVATNDAIWVYDDSSDTYEPGSRVLKIDPERLGLDGKPLELGKDTHGIAAVGDAVWVAYLDGRLRRVDT